jgi:hypothetical protein
MQEERFSTGIVKGMIFSFISIVIMFLLPGMLSYKIIDYNNSVAVQSTTDYESYWYQIKLDFKIPFSYENIEETGRLILNSHYFEKFKNIYLILNIALTLFIFPLINIFILKILEKIIVLFINFCIKRRIIKNLSSKGEICLKYFVYILGLLYGSIFIFIVFKNDFSLIYPVLFLSVIIFSLIIELFDDTKGPYFLLSIFTLHNFWTIFIKGTIFFTISVFIFNYIDIYSNWIIFMCLNSFSTLFRYIIFSTYGESFSIADDGDIRNIFKKI